MSMIAEVFLPVHSPVGGELTFPGMKQQRLESTYFMKVMLSRERRVSTAARMSAWRASEWFLLSDSRLKTMMNSVRDRLPLQHIHNQSEPWTSNSFKFVWRRYIFCSFFFMFNTVQQESMNPGKKGHKLCFNQIQVKNNVLLSLITRKISTGLIVEHSVVNYKPYNWVWARTVII